LVCGRRKRRTCAPMRTWNPRPLTSYAGPRRYVRARAMLGTCAPVPAVEGNTLCGGGKHFGKAVVAVEETTLARLWGRWMEPLWQGCGGGGGKHFGKAVAAVEENALARLCRVQASQQHRIVQVLPVAPAFLSVPPTTDAREPGRSPGRNPATPELDRWPTLAATGGGGWAGR